MSVFQNHDLDLNKFFTSWDLTQLVLDIGDIRNCQLSEKIYYRPNVCPLVDIKDSQQGSCFKDYLIPTGSYYFEQTDQGLTSNTLIKSLNLTDYIDSIHHEITNNVLNIFNHNNKVVFCFSGGIDALTVLSYIIKLGFVNRIQFAVYHNKISRAIDTVYYNFKQQELINKLANNLNVGIDYVEITEEKLVDRINNRSVDHVRAYATSCLFDSYTDTSFVTGHHGNQILLHKDIFWDEIILQQPSAKEEIKNFLHNNKTFYTAILAHYNLNRPMVPIEHVYLTPRMWNWFDGINGNRVYGPLGNNQLFQLLRTVDFKTVSIESIAHASVARELIARNVGSMLDEYIVKENLTDNDSLAHVQKIALDKIDPNVLIIPENLNHSPEGYQWLINELDQARQTGWITINVLVTLKTLQKLSQI